MKFQKNDYDIVLMCDKYVVSNNCVTSVENIPKCHLREGGSVYLFFKFQCRTVIFFVSASLEYWMLALILQHCSAGEFGLQDGLHPSAELFSTWRKKQIRWWAEDFTEFILFMPWVRNIVSSYEIGLFRSYKLIIHMLTL